MILNLTEFIEVLYSLYHVIISIHKLNARLDFCWECKVLRPTQTHAAHCDDNFIPSSCDWDWDCTHPIMMGI